jgi:hypothetical protein
MAASPWTELRSGTRSNAASGKFTPEGVKADALQFALSDIVPSFHKACQTIAKAKADVAERRSRLKVEGPDKSDLAGAMRRAEIRALLRGMKPKKQAQFFARHGDAVPAEVAAAVTEMPADFSGAPKTRHDLLAASALEAQHGAEIAESAELEEAIAAAVSAVEIGRDEVRLEAVALDERNFNELEAPVEQKRPAPWLRRRKSASGVEEIRVVDLDRRVQRLATPDEIERGIFYRDFDRFKEEKAA